MNSLEPFFQTLSGFWSYVFLFLSSLIENLFPPMPGDTFVVLGAVLVGKGKMNFLPAYVSTTAGSILGFMICYTVGLKWGIRIFKGRPGRIFSERNLERIHSWFDQYGYGVLVVNRFLAGFRSVVAFGAGIAKMSAFRVFLFGLISCFLWNGILMVAGIAVGEHWSAVVKNYQRIVFGLLTVLVLGWLLKSNLFKQR